MDIVLAVALCVINAKIVKKKNRNPAGIIAITLGLTVGVVIALSLILLAVKLPSMGLDETMTSGELMQVITEGMSDYVIYITYLPLILGGVVSFLIAKKMKAVPPRMMQDPMYGGPMYGQNPGGPMYGQNPGGPMYGQNPGGPIYGQNPGGPMYGQNPGGPMYVQNPVPTYAQTEDMLYSEPYDEEKMLKVPCTICVIRDNAVLGENDLYTISLNGHHACRLANGTYANIMTNRKQNTITARDGAGASLRHPITFMAVDGGYVEIHVSGGAFVPEKTIGRKPSSQMS